MYTPGWLGSAQPVPQLITPTSLQTLSSWQTSGPPLSPCRKEQNSYHLLFCYSKGDCWNLFSSKRYLTGINITLCVASTEHPWCYLSIIHTRAIAYLCAYQRHLSFFQCVRNMNCAEQNKLTFVYLLQSPCFHVHILGFYNYSYPYQCQAV